MSPPPTITGLGLMGFECCTCKQPNISTRCDNCTHTPCPSCTIFDHAGRVLSKHMAVGLHFLCQCGEFVPVVGSLVKQQIHGEVCGCWQPAFVALYNNYGRLCEWHALSVELPFVLATEEDVQVLVIELGRTAWGPGIRAAQE